MPHKPGKQHGFRDCIVHCFDEDIAAVAEFIEVAFLDATAPELEFDRGGERAYLRGEGVGFFLP